MSRTYRAGYRDGIEETVLNRCRTAAELDGLDPYYVAGYKAGVVDWYHCRDDVEKSLINFRRRLDNSESLA